MLSPSLVQEMAGRGLDLVEFAAHNLMSDTHGNSLRLVASTAGTITRPKIRAFGGNSFDQRIVSE
jgi:hypothetical protein